MNDAYLSKKKSVVFLFINGPHHVYHLIYPALKFVKLNNSYEVKIISGNPWNTKIINQASSEMGVSDFKLIDIPLPLRYKIKNYKGKLYPPVYSRIKSVINHLSDASAIISTSHELPVYLNEQKINDPILFYLYHGTGTRAYGFEKKLDGYDYIFVPGNYHLNRLLNESCISKEKMILTGMPKLDWLKTKLDIKRFLFKNNNPTFYYNPHWDMKFSSYLKWKNHILNLFTERQELNLIFSPHPLVKHMSKREGYTIEEGKKYTENIIVDYGSDYCMDGTYNFASDVYIGDVSSMVTEFIIYKPRPCLFINAHDIDWVGNEDYHFWKMGNVVNDANDFPKHIFQSLESNHHEEKQLKMKNDFVHQSSIDSSKICAKSIQNILRETNT